MAWAHRTIAKEWEIVGLSGRHTQREIAALAGVSTWTVFDVQRKYHVVQRFGRCHVAARRYAIDEHVWGPILEELYVRQRLPQAEVAARCGIGVDTVRRRLDALGFRIRTGGETNSGKRRRAYRWKEHLPVCASPGCTTRVAAEGEGHCARCRRSARRRAGALAS